MRQWILLRGLARESAHWGDFLADFERALPRDRVQPLDLPGNGQLHRQPSPLSVPAMVRACREALAGSGIAPPYHLLAVSLGAMVATEWARVAPAEVAGCVLINTSFRPFSPFYHRLRPRNYAALLRLALWGGAPQQIEQVVLRLTSNSAPERQQVVRDWAAVRARRPVQAANALRQLVAAARYRAPRVGPVARILLLASHGDGLVRSQCSQAVASAWRVPVVLHPRAGHDLPLDDPRWVIRQVQDWLAEIDGAR
ncbi:alpha/beta hydrolase [Acidovorax sp. sif1233]|uniref:alpha/beta fold hydrolase n=1 Tax=Acidovorax sp. sif1233 TaxID=2854792 RepID=UPI001C486B17|nr:alpha/beta hydrolase [Acidovorax sp. sif1233]MBV7455952.1 alpha/beta hydrolase [Acidovorax sp. sif1233]